VDGRDVNSRSIARALFVRDIDSHARPLRRLRAALAAYAENQNLSLVLCAVV
jgi:hypothetical protein